MPTSSFKINTTASTDDPTNGIDAVFESNYPDSGDFAPIIYPQDLLKEQTYDNQDKMTPFVGFYILLPTNARAVPDAAALDDTSTNKFLELRGLDYASEVNKDLTLRVGSDLSNGTISGVANAFVAAASAASAAGAIRVYRRVNLLKHFICLYMPETWNNDMTAAYSNLSLGQALRKVGAVSDMVKHGMNGDFSKVWGADLTNLLATLSDSGGIFGMLGTAEKFIQAGLGIAINPLSEMFFENMQFRQFTMDFKFVPRNEQEAKTIRNIIKTFRMYMVPEIKKDSTVGLFMSVPAFFQIKYYIQQNGEVTENENMPKISGCVLTGVTVDGAPDGFAIHKDGMPVAIRMQLYFTELEIMHRDRIKQGY